MQATTVLAAVTTVAVAVALAVPSPASASEPSGDAEPGQVSLERLGQTQRRAEIDALVDGTEPVRLLVDATTGRVEAAARVDARALSPVGPGCTTTSVCMRTISEVP